MNLPSHLRMQIDACRVGEDDLALPELAELAQAVAEGGIARATFERAQSNDAVLRDAVRDVPLPAGLERRLFAALEAATEKRPGVSHTNDSRDLARFWPATLLLVAASILVAIGLFNASTTEPLAGQTFAAAALDWRHNDQLLSGDWKQDITRVRAAYPFPARSLRRDLVPLGWQTCGSGQFGLSGVVYNMTERGDQRAYLFVFRAQGQSVDGLMSAPHSWPLRTTGGWSVGAWADGDLVYVLLAEGEADRFQSLVRASNLAA